MRGFDIDQKALDLLEFDAALLHPSPKDLLGLVDERALLDVQHPQVIAEITQGRGDQAHKEHAEQQHPEEHPGHGLFGPVAPNIVGQKKIEPHTVSAKNMKISRSTAAARRPLRVSPSVNIFAFRS